MGRRHQCLSAANIIHRNSKPIYSVSMLMNYIEVCIEEIERCHSNALVILAGDVNQLSDNEIVERTGLFVYRQGSYERK